MRAHPALNKGRGRPQLLLRDDRGGFLLAHLLQRRDLQRSTQALRARVPYRRRERRLGVWLLGLPGQHPSTTGRAAPATRPTSSKEPPRDRRRGRQGHPQELRQRAGAIRAGFGARAGAGIPANPDPTRRRQAGPHQNRLHEKRISRLRRGPSRSDRAPRRPGTGALASRVPAMAASRPFPIPVLRNFKKNRQNTTFCG